MASTLQSSHSSDSNSSQSSDSNSKVIALPTPTDASRVQTIPKTFKSSKRKGAEKRKCGEATGAAIDGASNARDNGNAEEKEEKYAGRSWVWLHFKKIEKPHFEIKDGKKVQTCVKERAKCNYCGTDLACDSYGNGTSSLRRHILEVCKKYLGRVDLESGQQVLSTGGTKELVMQKWTQEACREAACKMIVMDELPFSFIERPGFRYFCRVAVPRWDVPSRRVIVKQFLSMYKAAKVELKKELKSHCLCLTTDTWTSVQNINYMVLTAHFVDSGWTLHKRILNFRVIPNHQGTSIGKLLEAFDNASANKVAIDYIRKKMLGWENHLFLEAKKEKVESKKVCILDVPTRWNSIFLMLDTALELRKAFDRMTDEEDSKYEKYFDEDEDIDEEDDELQVGGSDSRKKPRRKRIGPPIKEDWEKAAVFVRFLKVFYDVIMRISASNHPTSWKAFHDIVAIKSEIHELFTKPHMCTGSETEMILFDMAVKMRGKFDKYFGSFDDCNQLLFIALVLNPRFKIRNFESICNKWLKMETDDVKKKSAELKELLRSLCDLYSSMSSSLSTSRTGKAKSGESSVSQGIKSSSKK
ncbi:zinc finger BED domain-containing protein RICESLEEPER 4-like [Rosa chinensis]|uniref:zinc finger BED domain-containing protein RICESLEEPER 4-like n=1 Tax=Rosa chinensis TaxID=74649 RepID=UPI000D095204|nr:zinc finger BED domain-containing protein RICESLEEPER 4-like [Rosa chinensis]